MVYYLEPQQKIYVHLPESLFNGGVMLEKIMNE